MRQSVAGAAAIALMASGCGGGSGGANGGGGGGSGGDIVMTRDAALGARYGAAGPRSCAPKTVPADGSPSPEQAAKYVICASEHESASDLYLVTNVTVTGVAPGRPYNINEDVNMGNIDITKPIYAIRGSYDSFQCAQVQQPGQMDFGINYHKGTNCSVTHEKNAEGACYKDTFADWHCSMVDASATVNEQRNVAPPG